MYATSPLPYAVLLLLILVLCWHWLPRGVRWPAIVVEVLLVAMMTPLGAGALVRIVESRLPPMHACAAPAPDTIVVLSAGFDRPPTGPDDYGALQVLGLQRVFAGVKLWRRLPGARLVIAGGGRSSIPQSVPMANLARQLGVPAESIAIESRSHSTWENARNVAALSPAVPKHIWLVTSALHMPRALGAFRAWGFSPCAWPSDPRDTHSRLGAWAFIPQGQSTATATLALHELVGSVQYAWLERQHARRRADSQSP